MYYSSGSSEASLAAPVTVRVREVTPLEAKEARQD